MKKTIKVGSGRASEVYYDPETDAFIAPSIWRVDGGNGRKITVNVIASGYSEKELRDRGWCGLDDIVVDDYSSSYDIATVRYFKSHTMREVLAGDNPNVFVKSLVVDECGTLTAEFEVKRNLEIHDSFYLNAIFASDLVFDILVWDDQHQPIEKYAIAMASPCAGDTTIIEYRDNGENIAMWPIENVLEIQDVDVTGE